MSIGRLPEREQRILDEMERVLRRDRRFQRRLRRLSRSALVLPTSPSLRARRPGIFGGRSVSSGPGPSGGPEPSGSTAPPGSPSPSDRSRLLRRSRRPAGAFRRSGPDGGPADGTTQARHEGTRPRPAFRRYPGPWTVAVLLAVSVTLMVYGITTYEPGVIWAFAAVWPLTLYTAFRLLRRPKVR
ncbi:hypothetical protein ACIA8J_29115 [Streptomyces asoensis]|uniref:hypothetical protein n=1 Tax=Streptomyces asoensis TaxID=249586 RepID=UPI00379C5A48